MEIPKKVPYLIIGAGVHGLSTGYHLARYLKETGQGRGDDVLDLEKQAIHGLAIKAEGEDVQLMVGPEVTGFQLNSAGEVTVVETNYGNIEVGMVVVAVGPWINKLREMLALPLQVPDPQKPADKIDLWRFLALQEGEIEINPYIFLTLCGRTYLSSPILTTGLR